ncbi:GtrA family protein [Pedobacter frigidisoli]|uniref:GtrA family protein n=1 Tax=Pedobacter frigidisoli TaxID=2530455 RepID=UPI0029310C2A|nr:GtrA family protein [Pedobacter frigidisoli]
MALLTYIKAQGSSLTASAVDFSITVVARNFLGLWYVLASVLGTVSGGVVNFYVNRKWVFESQTLNMKRQIARYILVWVGNLVIVTAGVYLLTHFFNLNYVLSKIIISVITGLSYNYIMQRQFIFTS